MITPRVDSSDPVHGFIVSWITALAAQVEQLWVVTPRARREPLPDNIAVYEVGRGCRKKETILHAWLNFHRVMWHLTRDDRVDGIFAHMYPKFAILAVPYAKPRRIPLVMWYTHTSVSWQLRLAGKFVDGIVTASRGSCRLDSSKVRVVGHGIDTKRFSPSSQARHPDGALTVLSVGRISPAKHYEVIIEAVAGLIQHDKIGNLRLRLVGDAPRREQASYLEELKNLVISPGLSEHVFFEGAVPHDKVVRAYQQADVFVSASQTGLDKAVLEAMACGLIPVVSLPEFAFTLGVYAERLIYKAGDASDLARKLQYVWSLPLDEREQLGCQMRSLVREKHDVHTLMGRVVGLFEMLNG